MTVDAVKRALYGEKEETYLCARSLIERLPHVGVDAFKVDIPERATSDGVYFQ